MKKLERKSSPPRKQKSPSGKKRKRGNEVISNKRSEKKQILSRVETHG